MTIEEIKKVLGMSGIVLMSEWPLKSETPLSNYELALMFSAMFRRDLNMQEKAIILAGIVASPQMEE